MTKRTIIVGSPYISKWADLAAKWNDPRRFGFDRRWVNDYVSNELEVARDYKIPVYYICTRKFNQTTVVVAHDFNGESPVNPIRIDMDVFEAIKPKLYSSGIYNEYVFFDTSDAEDTLLAMVKTPRS